MMHRQFTAHQRDGHRTTNECRSDITTASPQQGYFRKPLTRHPATENSVPREVAGHVAKRTTRTVASLPPPKRRAKSGAQSKVENKTSNIPRKGGDEDPGDGKKGNGGNYGTDAPKPLLVKDNEEEYENPSEAAAWPDDIWNEEAETRTQTSIRLKLQEQTRKNRASTAAETEKWKYLRGWDDGIRHSKSLHGPGRQESYHLYSDGKDVWRYHSDEHNGRNIERHRSSNDGRNTWKIKIHEERLKEVGWVWDADVEKWYRIPLGDMERLFMDVMSANMNTREQSFDPYATMDL